MSSIKQQQANRLNAQKSTGPRTLQGKAVSRFDALKTGMDAESQIIPGEDPAAFQKLTEEYHQQLPDLHASEPLPNQPPNPGIGFVPSIRSATPHIGYRGPMERHNALSAGGCGATPVTVIDTGKSEFAW